MKSTAYFTQTILEYLKKRSETDALFAESFAKENKNIDDCCTYILNEVQKSGYNGFHDDEIFGLATDYYDEDDIEIGKPINGKIVVNHVVELTEEEKEQAKQDAIQMAMNEASKTILKVKKKTTNKSESVQQLSLF